MMPERSEELEHADLDARMAFRRIATAYGVQRTIPYGAVGWVELCTLVEKERGLARAAAEPKPCVYCDSLTQGRMRRHAGVIELRDALPEGRYPCCRPCWALTQKGEILAPMPGAKDRKLP